jgi:hypothetical protein
MYYFLDNFSIFQSELLIATEAAKTSQRADLENHLKTAQNTFDEKHHEIIRLKQQLDEVGCECVWDGIGRVYMYVSLAPNFQLK